MTASSANGPAMEITTQQEADSYFEECVAHTMECFGETREQAERIERSSLGYKAGYYDTDTRRRVERLFRCAHPIFGSIERRGSPTPDEALTIGRLIGRSGRCRASEVRR